MIAIPHVPRRNFTNSEPAAEDANGDLSAMSDPASATCMPPPIAVAADGYTVSHNETLTIGVPAEASDPEGEALTFASATMGSGNGSVLVSGDGQTITYTPGNQVINYTLQNTNTVNQYSQTGTITVDVTNGLPQLSSSDSACGPSATAQSVYDVDDDTSPTASWARRRRSRRALARAPAR